MGSGSSTGGGEWGRGPPPNAHIIYKIGVYGWRKRCLYIFILLLMVIVIINFALTIWILKVMDFSTEGMGNIRIMKGSIRIEGEAAFLKTIYASHLKSLETQPLHLTSAGNITLDAMSGESVVNRFVIGDHKMQSYARNFEIFSQSGELLFSANENEVTIGAEKLTVTGGSGAIFHRSIQTPVVRSSQSLRLESPTNTLRVEGPMGVEIRTDVGKVNINSLDNITLESKHRAIRLNAKNVTIKNLFLSEPEFDGQPYPEVYQLCICAANGKLFVAPSRGNCQATNTVCN